MLRPALLTLLFFVYLLPTSLSPVWADAALHMETFKLRNRPANDLLPLIKPFLHPEGAISGQGYSLFIKSTGANLKQISEMITELDVALKRLRISISTDANAFEEQEKLQIHNHSEAVRSSDNPNVRKIIIEKGAQHKVTTRVYSTVDRTRQPAAQHVQLLEGQWAKINTGHAIPVADRRLNSDGTVTETISYRKVSTGFSVRAHVNGNNVYLTLRPKQEALSQQGGGVIVTQSIDTSLSVKLGQWTKIGGTQQTTKQSDKGITHRTQRKQETESQMFIKVELLE